MMLQTLGRRWWLVIMLMVPVLIAMPLLTACGGDDNDDETTSATNQATTITSAQTTGAKPTTTATGDEPVKIGVITTWSGPAAMLGMYYIDPIIKVVEKQVEDMGGILGGRRVAFVKYDTGGQVSEALSGATKLLTADKVSAISDVADEEKVFFASSLTLPDVADKKYTAVCSISDQSTIDDAVRLISEVMTPTPQTVGIITFNDPGARNWTKGVTEGLDAAGIEVIYEELITHDIMDFSPYLTNLKYEDPDCVVTSLDNAQYLAIAKQIMELGGWGDMQMIAFGLAAAAAGMPGAEGWIIVSPWHVSQDDPESVRFKEDFEAVNGKLPQDLHVYFYNTLWTAVHAIELAGTDDPADIAEEARSGNLEFDTPMGRAHIGTDGENGLRNMYVQVQEGGVIVPFSQ